MHTLCEIRHGESATNQLATAQGQDRLHESFVREYDNDPDSELAHLLACEVFARMTELTKDRDIPLSDAAEQQVRTAARFTQTLIAVPDVVYVSPFKRTVDTLDIMQNEWPALRDVPVLVDERLREQDRGLLEHFKSWRVLNVFHPELRTQREAEGRYMHRYPGAENMPDVEERVGNWLHSAEKDYPGSNVLAVTHVGTIIATRAVLEMLSPSQVMDLHTHDTPRNASATIYRRAAGHLTLQAYNVAAAE